MAVQGWQDWAFEVQTPSFGLDCGSIDSVVESSI